jgi:hypothetical protein
MKNITTFLAALLFAGILGLSATPVVADEANLESLCESELGCTQIDE